MTEGQLGEPQVYVDKVNPQDAPAAVGGPTADLMQQRVQAVENRYEQRAETLPQIAQQQPEASTLEAQTPEKQAQVAQAQANLDIASNPSNVVEPTGINAFSTVRNFRGLRTPDQRDAAVATTTEQLNAAQAELEEHKLNVDSARLYSPEYLRRESNPNRIAEILTSLSRGGSETTSPEMSAALAGQDALQAEIRFYQEKGLNPDTLLPPRVFGELIDLALAERRNFRVNSAEQARLALAAINEVALLYAKEHGTPIDQEQLTQVYMAGYRITQHVHNETEIRNYVRGKRGSDNFDSSDAGYYAMGAYDLESFFNDHNIPDGHQRIPYVFAYAAGALLNGAPMQMEHHLRDWLSECLPAKGSKRTYIDGQWIDNVIPDLTRGLGSYVERMGTYGSFKIEQQGTVDQHAVEVMKQANNLVTGLAQAMRDHGDSVLSRQLETYNLKDPELLVIRS